MTISPRGFVNIESWFGLALTLIVAIRRRRAEPGGEGPVWKHPRAIMIGILLLTFLCYARALPNFFLDDEFMLLRDVRGFDWGSLRYVFTHGGGEAFFRPLVWAFLGLESHWAGVSPVAWHLPGLAGHLAICWLIYLLARRLYPGTEIPVWAAAFFALHGSHVEPVTYMASNFDMLATFFTVAGLVLLLKYCDERRPVWMAASLVCAAAALLSKESAYVFPILAMLLIWRRARWRVTLPFWLLTAAIFVIRWWMVGGIGGYKLGGRPQILTVTPLGLLKGFGMRIWAVLYFPVNWTVPLEAWLIAALVLAAGAYIWLGRYGGDFADKREWLVPIGFIIASAVPVVMFLVIGPDLMSSAHVYLSSVGFALLMGALVERRRAAAVALLIFQLAALEHHLTAWHDVSILAKKTCDSAAAGANVGPLPDSIHGAHFFTSGFDICVEMERARSR